MTTTAKFQALIKSSYTPPVLKSLKLLGIILGGLNLILAMYIFTQPQIFIDLFLASLLLFAGLALAFPALRIGFMTLRFTFICIKKVVMWFLQIPKEVKLMSSFQRYVLLLVSILLIVILIAIAK